MNIASAKRSTMAGVVVKGCIVGFRSKNPSNQDATETGVAPDLTNVRFRTAAGPETGPESHHFLIRARTRVAELRPFFQSPHQRLMRDAEPRGCATNPS